MALHDLAPIGTTEKFAQADVDAFADIDDRGSDVTFFAYSGLAAMFVGLPAFEFRGLLRGSQHTFNTVCIRDIRRISYHVRPDGGKDGLAFYEEQTRAIMKKLGAKHN